MSEIVRPSYREEEKKIDPVEERKRRAEVTAWRREHMERQSALDTLQIIKDAITYGHEHALISSGYSEFSSERIEQVRKALREGGTE
jgi:hypothetical protein